MPKGPFNNYNMKTKNNVKLNNFKQFTMSNRIPRRSKFPDKINNLNCFQQVKFLHVQNTGALF